MTEYLCHCSADEEQLVSGSSDGSVRVWNIDSLKCVHTLEGHTADVNCLVAQVSSQYLHRQPRCTRDTLGLIVLSFVGLYLGGKIIH